MLIDWFTVGAQILNFLVLLVLLKIFLFDRIIQAMDERESKINARFEEADREKEAARQKAESLAEEKRELEEDRGRLMEDAKAEAEDQRQQWIDRARREIDAQREQWEKALADQKEAFNRDLQHLAAAQVYAAARRALKDVADEALEERIIEELLERVAKMESEAKEKFSRSQSRPDGTATVRSAFEVSTRMRRKITRVLRREFAEDLEVDYQTEPDMLAGIELKAGGHKISWSLAQYLQTLEEKVIQAIAEHAYEREASKRDDTRQPPNGQQRGGSENEQRSD